jgi:hypothetical protein
VCGRGCGGYRRCCGCGCVIRTAGGCARMATSVCRVCAECVQKQETHGRQRATLCSCWPGLDDGCVAWLGMLHAVGGAPHISLSCRRASLLVVAFGPAGPLRRPAFLAVPRSGHRGAQTTTLLRAPAPPGHAPSPSVPFLPTVGPCAPHAATLAEPQLLLTTWRLAPSARWAVALSDGPNQMPYSLSLRRPTPRVVELTDCRDSGD